MSDLKSIKQSICGLIEDIAPEVNTDNLDHNDDIRDELDLDSMDFIRLLEGIDKTLGVNIPESDYGKVNTLHSMADYISGKLN
jgi:acyl carrier protein